MVSGGLTQFKGKRVLLLQGPIGPFFCNLAKDLNAAGAQVFKFNFNGGDCLYYPRGAMNFRGRMDQWELVLNDFLDTQAIDMIMMFGDCRSIHVTARRIARQRGIKTGVFEEGYIRPDYITFETGGANALSTIPRNPEFYAGINLSDRMTPRRVQKAFRSAAWLSVYYYFAAAFMKPFFPHYKHHRPLHLFEGLRWVRSFYRKQYFKLTEQSWQSRLTGVYRGRYFLVPLQVAHDAQVRSHSHYASVVSFILQTVESFAANAPRDALLVIKHHPMDRAYNDYTRLIRSLAAQYDLQDRLVYLHDQHLPSLLAAARGVVVINSTVGLSALHHGTPTKVCGQAIYDMPGLTFQGELDRFWTNTSQAAVNDALYQKFSHYVIRNTQLNGSFYSKLGNSNTACGVVWDEGLLLAGVKAADHDAAPRPVTVQAKAA